MFRGKYCILNTPVKQTFPSAPSIPSQVIMKLMTFDLSKEKVEMGNFLFVYLSCSFPFFTFLFLCFGESVYEDNEGESSKVFLTLLFSVFFAALPGGQAILFRVVHLRAWTTACM